MQLFPGVVCRGEWSPLAQRLLLCVTPLSRSSSISFPSSVVCNTIKISPFEHCIRSRVHEILAKGMCTPHSVNSFSWISSKQVGSLGGRESHPRSRGGGGLRPATARTWIHDLPWASNVVSGTDLLSMVELVDPCKSEDHCDRGCTGAGAPHSSIAYTLISLADKLS